MPCLLLAWTVGAARISAIWMLPALSCCVRSWIAVTKGASLGASPSAAWWACRRTMGLRQDRRPVTVLSTFYRCWAARMAFHAGLWMDRYMRPGLHGGRRTHSAAGAAWSFTLDVDLHRAHGTAFHALAMDQEQWFDSRCNQ